MAPKHVNFVSLKICLISRNDPDSVLSVCRYLSLQSLVDSTGLLEVTADISFGKHLFLDRTGLLHRVSLHEHAIPENK